MSFKNLSKAYAAATPKEREAACIEYATFTGNLLGSGHMSQETVFSLKGDGTVEYLRRGDFAERGDVHPGLWRARIEPAKVEEAWKRLADLTQDSFPARAADPGETVNRITAYVPGSLDALNWGPSEPGVDIPGEAFLIFLAPFINAAVEGECLWSVEMSYLAALQKNGSVDIRVGFKNPGSSPIGIFLPAKAGRGGFILRHAVDKPETPGVTPLPVEWNFARAGIPDRENDSLWDLGPGEELSVVITAPVELKKGVRYIGKLHFEQSTHLDVLAGARILSGACFTEVFEFEL